MTMLAVAIASSVLSALCLLKTNLASCTVWFIWTEMASEGSSLGAELDDMVPLQLPPASTEDCVEEVIEEAKTIDNGIADPASADGRVEEVTEEAKTIDNGIAEVSDEAKIPAAATPVASPGTPPSLNKKLMRCARHGS